MSVSENQFLMKINWINIIKKLSYSQMDQTRQTMEAIYGVVAVVKTNRQEK